MIPKGSIFFSLRSKALDFYPERCQSLHRERLTFTDWIKRGTYVPVSTTKSQIVFEASPHDVASIFLSAIEFFSNSCFEHLQENLCFSTDGRIRSDAWNIVNIYYFAFFVAQALLRLLGNPVVFVTKDALKLVGSVIGSSNVPGGGAFRLEKIEELSATLAKYRLKTIRKRAHEATWKELLTLLEKESGTPAKDPKEILFYQALTTKTLSNIYSHYAWPSLVRNKANYTPGLAYCLVENQIKGKTRRLINVWENCSESEVLRILNSSVASCNLSDQHDLSNHVCLLHNVGHSLFILFRELYFELINRRQIDRRMELKRRLFIKKMAIPDDISYPFTKTT
jgi:hypothetical protein